MVRVSGGSHWRAVENGNQAGEVRAWVRPDRRCSVWFRECADECCAPLLAAITAEIDHDLYVEVDESDAASLTRFVRLGFTVSRREDHLAVPTDPAANGLGRAALPAGMTLLSAADADEDRLRELDDLLRQDVPGADGWHWDRAGFAAETFSSAFDPATYLVAVDSAGRYAGLARVWNNPVIPRLGLIAVTREHRRAGLARSLLARAFLVLHERRIPEVSAEVDSSNDASLTLMRGLGARRTGGSVELILRVVS